MKNKLIKLLTIFVAISLISGCGIKNYIVDKNDKVVIYEKTGQNVPTNILCKPTDKDLLDIYKKYESQLKKPLNKLPDCSNFKANIKGSKSMWEGLFVKPLAYLIIKLGKLLNNYGISVILVGLAIRIILLPMSIKTQKQSENMKKINPEIKRIEKKYANQTTNDAMMAKSQEMMALYKKYNVSPFSSCLIAFIQLPLFFAFLQAINRVPVIFEDSLFGMYLGMSPLTGIKSGHYIYIALIVLIALTTYFSLKKAFESTSSINSDQAKSMKTTLYFSIALIVYTSFRLSTAIGLYWVSTNGFIVIQNYIIQKMIEKEPKKRDNKKEKKKNRSIKEKVEKRR